MKGRKEDINDVLIYSNSIEQHFKHLQIFYEVTKRNGLVIFERKISLFQTRIKFIGHYIENGFINPIERTIKFSEKFPDQITDKKQLQRFLGSLNYISDFYKEMSKDCKLLFQRLKKEPTEWTKSHTEAVKKIKLKVKEIPCLSIANPNYFKIVETDASDIGYGGILKQRINNKS